MTNHPAILILGCGNMGGAMLAGWLAAEMPANFTVVDPVVTEVPKAVRLLRQVPAERFDVVLLGVKPQALDEAASVLAPVMTGQTLLLSLLAGAELASLAARFPRSGGIVRVMPNLAAAIGKSPIGLYGADLSQTAHAAVTALLTPLGTPEWLAGEDQLDAVTALVGSGPAFVYRFIEALAAGGTALGLDSAQAQRLALSMVESAAALAVTADKPPAELARQVTSPGGTTAAGLGVLDQDTALVRLVADTLRAARNRGAELADAVRG